MAISTDALEPLPLPEPPPAPRLPPREWVKENLLSPWHNALMTVVFGGILGWALLRALRFVFVTGRWEIIRRNLTNFMVALYPRDQLWRVWTALFVVTLAIGLRIGAGAAGRLRLEEEARRPALRVIAARIWPLALLVAVIATLSGSLRTIALLLALGVVAAAAYALGRLVPPRTRRWTSVLLIAGFVAGFEIVAGFGGVGLDRWGGLLLTLFLAGAGIVLSFPLGLLLALGRRSRLPAVRGFCVGYIELIRGVPLVTLIFMGAFVVGLFLPPGSSTPSLAVRGLVAIVLFTAAYLAEIIRGGLQSVPRGQIEAAMAVGLSPFTMTRLIVLPQALRAVIPAIVGQFISLFKDTSLVSIVGLVELLRVSRVVTQQPDFLAQGLEAETFVFASFLYWVGAYWMSKESRRLERRLGVGER
jgi:general L-amino acid transport system permease protein